MQEALDRADFEAVAILGHNLRGSGGAFGFQAITDFGAGLELASEDNDLEKARTLLRELSSYLKGIEIPA
jgi:HPt (histidine-containing phosphotransfer) domain-containing protein